LYTDQLWIAGTHSKAAICFFIVDGFSCDTSFITRHNWHICRTAPNRKLVFHPMGPNPFRMRTKQNYEVGLREKNRPVIFCSSLRFFRKNSQAHYLHFATIPAVPNIFAGEASLRSSTVLVSGMKA